MTIDTMSAQTPTKIQTDSIEQIHAFDGHLDMPVLPAFRPPRQTGLGLPSDLSPCGAPATERLGFLRGCSVQAIDRKAVAVVEAFVDDRS